MRHEKIIKRDDGTEIRIDVYVVVSDGRDAFGYFIELATRHSDEDWEDVYYPSRYQWSNALHREAEKITTYLQLVTPDEIQTAKLELWQKLKPE